MGVPLGTYYFFFVVVLGGKGERIDVDSVMFRMGMRDFFFESFFLPRVEDAFIC